MRPVVGVSWTRSATPDGKLSTPNSLPRPVPENFNRRSAGRIEANDGWAQAIVRSSQDRFTVLCGRIVFSTARQMINDGRATDLVGWHGFCVASVPCRVLSSLGDVRRPTGISERALTHFRGGIGTMNSRFL